jgi:hypothetical protein
MAKQQQEEGKGVLFSNDKKGNAKAPDFKGEIKINGQTFRLSAWKRTSAYGELISLQHNTFNQTQYPREVKSFDDEVPF